MTSLLHNKRSKFAGGALTENGDIFLTSAFGRFAAKYEFDNSPIVSAEMKLLLSSPYFNRILETTYIGESKF